MLAPRRAAFAEESAEVEVLYANLEKMKSLTKKIQGSMTRLDVSGRTVQEAIGPIYGNTQRLQTTSSNVDKILEAIEKVREPLDMRNKEERILRSRPDRVGLNEYISSIDRTNQALKDLKSTNMRSNQQAITELQGLLSSGAQSLEGVFRDMLRQDSQPIEPLQQITRGAEFPRLSSGKSGQLRTINQHISQSAANASGRSDDLSPSAKVYSRERGDYISLSLQNLSAASLSTAKKTSADAVYKQNTNAIGTYAQGIQGMFLAEYDNICPVFAREEWGAVLLATCQNALQTFAKTLQDLDAHIRTNLITDCYLAYEIVGVVSTTSFQLENRTGELKQPMSDALKPVRETAKNSLSALLNDTKAKVQQIATLSMEGSSVPYTTDVMTRLQLMTAYLPPLSSIMRSLGDGGWKSNNTPDSSTSVPTMKSFDVGADGKQLFAHYASDTIDTLLTALESRSRALLKGKGLHGVFLFNNVAVIERMIRSSDLQPVLGNAPPIVESWKKKSTQAYMELWKETSGYLFDVQHTSKTPRPPSTGRGVDSAAVVKTLSSKEKDTIKEKFRNFNTSFDDCVARHKSFKIEPEVRRVLAHDVQRFIEPLYGRFWERYHEIDKGKGKYVKYDKSQLNGVLASLG
ncbi:hypothetical protein MBLNU230_g5188t1 [Neophaeotheca triangularis]